MAFSQRTLRISCSTIQSLSCSAFRCSPKGLLKFWLSTCTCPQKDHKIRWFFVLDECDLPHVADLAVTPGSEIPPNQQANGEYFLHALCAPPYFWWGRQQHPRTTNRIRVQQESWISWVCLVNVTVRHFRRKLNCHHAVHRSTTYLESLTKSLF